MNRWLPAAPALALGTLLMAAPAAAQGPRLLGYPVEPAPGLPIASEAGASASTPRLFGVSGKLRAAIVQSMDVLDFPFLTALTAAEAPRPRWVSLFGGDGEVA